jgi:hypothetical protein
MQTRHVWGEVRQLRADASAGASRAKVGIAQDFGSADVLRDSTNGRRWAEPVGALRRCERTPTRCVTHSGPLSRTAIAGACPCDVANQASQVLGVFLFLGEDGLE